MKEKKKGREETDRWDEAAAVAKMVTIQWSWAKLQGDREGTREGRDVSGPQKEGMWERYKGLHNSMTK